MQTIGEFIVSASDFIWTYVLIILLIATGIYFTWKSRFLQFRAIKEMFVVLGEKPVHGSHKRDSISSFQAFTISLASRVGTGNLAGVASAIVIGGPGAVFWMWVIASIGALSSFVESTLAQLFKVQGEFSYIGGPAYYIQKGLKKRWLGVFIAILITFVFGLVFNSVQSNTIVLAFKDSFGFDYVTVGVILTLLTLLIIFGGVHRIAKISSIMVPFMAILYILVAFYIVIVNIQEVPRIFLLIIENAFGYHQAIGGTIGAAMTQGIKRGLFSNEAGMGSAPNAAATADISHPVKQGLIQALGVFTDTIVICSCTAFMILLSHVDIDGTKKGIELTQLALSNQIGDIGNLFITVCIFLFAFSSVLGNYYYGEANILFITSNHKVLFLYRLASAGMVMLGAVLSLELVWEMTDLAMAIMVFFNLIAMVLLSKYAFAALDDYQKQKRAGIKSPVFRASTIPEIEDELECWKD